jgi:hypothetical protein
MASSERAEAAASATSTAARATTETGSGLAAWASSSTSADTEASDRAVAAAFTTLSTDPAVLEFYLAVEVHYHRAREAWLAGMHRWTMFLAILFGTAAAGQLAPPLFAGLLVAAAAAADLCFDFTGRAAQHSNLARRYLVMAREFAVGREDEALRKKILAAIIDASGDEPPVYNAAKDLAHNLAIQSLGRDVAARAAIPPIRRLLAHVWRFDGV